MRLIKHILLAFVLVISSIVLFAASTKFSFSNYRLNDTILNLEEMLSFSNAICEDPINQKVKNIGAGNVTILWDDALANKWEYYVQEEGIGSPVGNGITSLLTEVIVSTTISGNALQPGTDYEFYVRAICGSASNSNWVGPFIFRTSCDHFTVLPFKESFDSNSPSYYCWRIVDTNDHLKTPGKQNTWEQSSSGSKSGDKAMYFYGFNNPNDGWLISPSIQLTGDIYELTFWYKSTSFLATEFEVLLSVDGIELDNFKNVLMPKTSVQIPNYTQKSIFIHGITGNVNIAWRVVSNGTAMLYLDDVSLEKADCLPPSEDVVISNLEHNKATITWKDNVNSGWDYFVKPAFPSGLPVGTPLSTTNKTITVQTTNGIGASALLPATEYEIYLRSTCDGTKKSKWIGPITFKTPCLPVSMPFWEGFNTDSSTIDCWLIVDNDKNKTGSGAFVSGIWQKTGAKYEGNGAMYYSGGPSNDDWLISPTFNLDSNKKYRLKYFYKTYSYNNTDFQVLYSTTGAGINDFKNVLVSKQGYNKDNWMEETVYISNISGPFNLAWHINTKNSFSNFYLDAVSFREIDCPEPIQLEVDNLTSDQVTIKWRDDFGANWEYFVQEAGGILPKGKGTSSSKKDVVITVDRFGKKIKPNTEYEFFVRTTCGGNDNSIWAGPYIFRTACVALDLPFWEGFNSNSQTVYCWSINDVNKDANLTTSTGIWVKQDKTPYEGNLSMRFTVSDIGNSIESDDWLISPTFKLNPGKMYRLKYHYKTFSSSTKSEFEVVASQNGIDPKDFKTVIVPSTKYENIDYQEKKVFISNLSGDVNIAWHVKGLGSKDILIDNVFVEEVIGCPEPMTMGVENIDIHSADLIWQDDSGANQWEYHVQEAGGVLPVKKGTITSKNKNSVSKDYNGNSLKGNTKYEYYVRSICKDGSTSIWLGPFEFTTLCDVYQTPFWEGFNKNSETIRCWISIDENNKIIPLNTKWKQNAIVKHEGDQAIFYTASSSKAVNLNDWLISPTFNLDGGLYVLKYHYRTNTLATASNEFEVLLSTDGIDVTHFTTELVKKKKYTNEVFNEEVVFIDGIKGDINIAWHIDALNAKSANLFLDNIFLYKIDTCPEPYLLQTSNITTNGFDLEWQQYGTVNSWEVIVVNSGDPVTSTPIVSQVVTGIPKLSITGLSAGTGYTIYVRSKCADNVSYSNWSTSINAGTKIGGNDECIGAINIPVNTGVNCDKTIKGSLLGATLSINNKPSCSPTLGPDVWFEFTALATSHLLSVKDFKSISGASNPLLMLSLYNQPCGNTVTALDCTSLNLQTTPDWVLGGLVVGQKYYLRLGVAASTKVVDFIFNLCLTTSTSTPLTVIPSGTSQEIEDLIKKVLIRSNCDLVSNINYQNGDGSPATKKYNTLGYFDKGTSNFPFDKGIVLSTNEIEYVSRPYMGYTADRGKNNERWIGDKDINDAIQNAGGGPKDTKRVTQIEFDFLAIKDSLKFEYLFASNSYHKTCGDACNVGALFAAWLIDLTTGEGINLAKVPDTNLPIAINTIRNSTKTGAACPDVNAIYFDKYYDNVDKAIDAPIDFVGFTKPLSSETMVVVPGRMYHIKLAVIDFCPTVSHSTAVFFNAGSFDLGDLDLGQDLTITNNTAICQDSFKIIESGVSEDPENITLLWYKDDKLIQGESKSSLKVSEAGKYSVIAKYHNISCEVKGEINVEIYPKLTSFINKPLDIEVCRFNIGETIIDLKAVEAQMFTNTNRNDFIVRYFYDEWLENEIIDFTAFKVDLNKKSTPIFIEIKNAKMECNDVFTFNIVSIEGDKPEKPKDIEICDSFILPMLKENQYYFSEAKGKGKQYTSGEVLKAGNYLIYIFQDNKNGCYEEVFFTVKVEQSNEKHQYNDIYESCKLYELPNLEPNQKYEIQVNNTRVSVKPGEKIRDTNTIVYVITESSNGICIDESMFTVYYEECPIPKGFSPNGDGINDSFDLEEYGVTSLKIYNRNGIEVYSFDGNYTNQWKGQDKKGKNLISGTYYYVIKAFDTTKTGWVQLNR